MVFHFHRQDLHWRVRCLVMRLLIGTQRVRTTREEPWHLAHTTIEYPAKQSQLACSWTV